MATVTNYTGAPTGTNTQPQRPGMVERLGLKAKHAIVIGCIGFVVTVALFCVGGYLAYNNLFGVAEATTAQSAPVATQRHTAHQAGEARDVMSDAPAGWIAMPDCRTVHKRVYAQTNSSGDVLGYICK